MDNQPKRLLERLLEAAIIIVVSAYLVRLATARLTCPRPLSRITNTNALKEGGQREQKKYPRQENALG